MAYGNPGNHHLLIFLYKTQTSLRFAMYSKLDSLLIKLLAATVTLALLPLSAYSDEYRPGTPIFQVDRVKKAASNYPTDPTADIDWTAGYSGVSDIQAAFNAARAAENIQLGISLPMLTMPSQATWDAMSDDEKALWLINHERIDRGTLPLHSIETNVEGIAQYYAQYLLDNDAWGHEEDGNDPWERLNTNAAINNCHDWLGIAENLAVFVTSGSSISLPVERSVFNWMYDDGSCCSWGHRHAILWTAYTNNSGPDETVGFLGIGRASGGPYQGPFPSAWNFAEMIVMNVFDPCSSWDYSSLIQLDGAITGLRVLTQHTPSMSDILKADINGDFKVEMEDVIMTLQMVSAMTP